MRKGQFIFNLLRPYFSEGTFENPYPNCHKILFNISDEKWDIIEQEWEKFQKQGQDYKFPKDPLNGEIMSEEHKKELGASIDEVLRGLDK